MKVVKVQFHKIDKEYFFLPEFTDDSRSDVQVGDSVLVETSLGKDMGLITDWADFQPSKGTDNGDNNKASGIIQQNNISDVKPMLRKASQEDFNQAEELKINYPKYLKRCRELCKEHNLTAMKLVDVAESFDRKRLTFYFIADSRVDFRDLVKDLVKDFRKKIRLQQIGVRDATKICGGLGSCGMLLCCHNWMEIIGNVSPDYIKDQELSHRGADRLTGPCGRLKCCLRFEEEAYKYNLNKLPKEGDLVKTKAGQGEVMAVHALKHSVDLKIDGAIVEYPYLEGNLCENKDDCPPDKK
ncbi:hypothetical protein K8R42_04360 [bacterium]|nr:hypothetical protein [bacterium]